MVEGAGGVAVEGVQEATEQVAEGGRERTARHQGEGEQGQHDTGIPWRRRRRRRRGEQEESRMEEERRSRGEW